MLASITVNARLTVALNGVSMIMINDMQLG